jgi:CRP-like cAMP-binding protein
MGKTAMASLLALTLSQPTRALAPGEALITQGDQGGELYVLETGRLIVERDGVAIASIAEPGALIGEISLLLGTDSSATVRADKAASVRVVEDGIKFLERTPLVALQVATLACARLNATSALLVELKKDAQGKAGEHSIFARIMNALVEPPAKPAVVRTHE